MFEVLAVYKSYETTKLYRDLKLRGAIIRDKELVMLPHEQAMSHSGVVPWQRPCRPSGV